MMRCRLCPRTPVGDVPGLNNKPGHDVNLEAALVPLNWIVASSARRAASRTAARRRRPHSTRRGSRIAGSRSCGSARSPRRCSRCTSRRMQRHLRRHGRALGGRQQRDGDALSAHRRRDRDRIEPRHRRTRSGTAPRPPRRDARRPRPRSPARIGDASSRRRLGAGQPVGREHPLFEVHQGVEVGLRRARPDARFVRDFMGPGLDRGGATDWERPQFSPCSGPISTARRKIVQPL